MANDKDRLKELLNNMINETDDDVKLSDLMIMRDGDFAFSILYLGFEMGRTEQLKTMNERISNGKRNN